MPQRIGTIDVAYYSAAVQEAIREWPPGLQARYVWITDLMGREGPHLGMPYTRPMGGGLFELRCRSHEGVGRAFYGMLPGRRIMLLHSFLKKTPKTPPRELAVAYRRLKEVRSEDEGEQ